MTRLFTVPRRFRRVQGALALTTALSILIPVTYSTVASATYDGPNAVLDEAWQIVNREYVDPEFNQVDWQAVRQDLLEPDYSSRDQAYAALRDALDQLDDPYTRFMDPQEFETLTNQTSGELSGVGIRLEVDERTELIRVVEPLVNSPAMAAGLRSGDLIVEIDGRPTLGMPIENASALIRGDIGTQVTLRIQRDRIGEFEVSLNRSRIALPAVFYNVRQEGPNRIGYIRLTEFSSHAPEQMRAAIESLLDEEVNGFVLDLRGNPGGLLYASIDISRMWINEGAIVHTVDRDGQTEDIFADETALTDLPLAVLVDGYSASSSEILTGALVDNERATVIGNQTFGKALVQSVHPLSDGSGLAVTVAHYYTPDGTDISELGISPNIEVRLTEEQQQRLSEDPSLVGTNADPYYAQALESLQAEMFANRVRSQSAQLDPSENTPSVTD